jgi:hypothetical protein
LLVLSNRHQGGKWTDRVHFSVPVHELVLGPG